MLNSASLGLSSHSCPTWLSHPSEINCFFLPTSYSSSGALYKFQSTCKPSSGKLQSPHVRLCVVRGLGRTGFPVFALKKRGKVGIGLSEFSDSDDEFDELFSEDGGDFRDEDNNDSEEEGMLLPINDMKKWLERNPRGFGQGKEYDTSIEDKLLEEMEQSRLAQAANLNKLKDSIKPNPNKKIVELQAPETFNTGVHVRISSLPKKKNIHRDLMAAFKEFPGMININPAIVGNKKTRDPICKGFAFVVLKSEGDATRFVQAFSRQNLTFGKVQKQIKCEIMNQPTMGSADELLVPNKAKGATRPIIPEDKAEQVVDLTLDNRSSELWEETSANNSNNNLANDLIRTRVDDDIEENVISVSEFHSDDGNSAPGKEQRPFSKGKEKRITKKKHPKERGPKLSVEIPASAKRLRIKEKAILTDVYSRYGVKSSSTSKKVSS